MPGGGGVPIGQSLKAFPCQVASKQGFACIAVIGMSNLPFSTSAFPWNKDEGVKGVRKNGG